MPPKKSAKAPAGQPSVAMRRAAASDAAASAVEVRNLTVTRAEIDGDAFMREGEPIDDFGVAPAGGKIPLPNATTYVEFDLLGVAVPYADFLRKTFTEGLRRPALSVGLGTCLRAYARPDTAGLILDPTTDPTMQANYEYFALDLMTVPLTAHLFPDERSAVFELKVTNETSAAAIVYTGHLRQTGGPPLDRPLFNPTFPIFLLEPGRSIHVRNIGIDAGFGYENARYHTGVATRAPIDIERHPDAAVRERAPRGAAVNIADTSGFVVSSLVADSRASHFRVEYHAMNESQYRVRAVAGLVEACGQASRVLLGLKQRLGDGEDAGAGDLRYMPAHFTVAPAASGGAWLAELRLDEASAFAGQCVAFALCENEPAIPNCAYDRAGRVVRVLFHPQAADADEARAEGARLLGAAIDRAVGVFAAAGDAFRNA